MSLVKQTTELVDQWLHADGDGPVDDKWAVKVVGALRAWLAADRAAREPWPVGAVFTDSEGNFFDVEAKPLLGSAAREQSMPLPFSPGAAPKAPQASDDGDTASLDEVLTAYGEASGGEFNATLLGHYIQRFPHFRDNLNRYAQVQLSSVRATQADIDGVKASASETAAPKAPQSDDKRDAQRYRWLRAQDNEDFAFSVVKNPHFDVFEAKELDAAIDAAMKEQSKP